MLKQPQEKSRKGWRPHRQEAKDVIKDIERQLQMGDDVSKIQDVLCQFSEIPFVNLSDRKKNLTIQEPQDLVDLRCKLLSETDPDARHMLGRQIYRRRRKFVNEAVVGKGFKPRLSVSPETTGHLLGKSIGFLILKEINVGTRANGLKLLRVFL